MPELPQIAVIACGGFLKLNTMGFTKQEVVGIECDNCKEYYINEDSGFSVWAYESDAMADASNKGWIEENGKHYCDKCFHYNDEDELIINAERTNENS